MVPLLSLAISGTCPLPITKSALAITFFSLHEIKATKRNIAGKILRRNIVFVCFIRGNYE
jgi:hypothetical protein